MAISNRAEDYGGEGILKIVALCLFGDTTDGMIAALSGKSDQELREMAEMMAEGLLETIRTAASDRFPPWEPVAPKDDGRPGPEGLFFLLGRIGDVSSLAPEVGRFLPYLRESLRERVGSRFAPIPGRAHEGLGQHPPQDSRQERRVA